MIIVSQDKKIITNFDNVIALQIDEHIKNSDGEKDYELNVVTERKVCTIGVYETEERAKKILQEITSEHSKYATISTMLGSDIRQICVIPKKYEMPKE